MNATKKTSHIQQRGHLSALQIGAVNTNLPAQKPPSSNQPYKGAK
jgi:hypothetical protein